MSRHLYIILLLPVLLFSCKEKQYLTGYYSYNEFQKECHWDHFLDEEYKPRQKWMDSLATLNTKDSVSMRIFLGCYCGDSKKWVPRFFSLKPQLPVSDIEIISVDTTKKDEKNYAVEAGVKKIPTFIFYKEGKEVGRMVEKPKGRIEKRLFFLLKNM